MKHILLLTLCLATALHAQQPAAAPTPHTFTSADGRKLTATIMEKTDTAVTIKRADDGLEFILPLDRLSAADQAFVKAWGTQPAATTPQPASPPKDEAQLALDDARKFAASGEYAKALERHEWFHANARKISPSMGGVRLSFALSDWVDLGAKYPPALDSLKKVRDAGTKALLSGDGTWDLFHDVRSINSKLSKAGNAGTVDTLQLFKQLDASQPDLAKRCFGLVVEDLIATNEAELFVKHAGDLKSFLAQNVERHVKNAAYHKERGTDSSYIGGLDRELKELTAFMAKIAESKGDTALADELRATTSQVVAAPITADPALPESWVVEPKYRSAREFARIPGTAGLMFATFEKESKGGYKNMRVGLICSDGLVLCDPDMDESVPPNFFEKNSSFGSEHVASYFRDHRVFPKLSGGKWGIVDVDGLQVVSPQWDWVGSFSEGLFDFTVAGKRGYANLKGEVVIQPHWAEVRPFSGGYAIVRASEGGKSSVIDRTGKIISDAVWDDVNDMRVSQPVQIPHHVSIFDYRPAELPPGLFWVALNEKWGLYDIVKTAPVGALQWDKATGNAHGFSQGRAWVMKEGKYGMIDLTGSVVLEPVWEGEKQGKFHKPPTRVGNFIKAIKDGKTAWWRLDGSRALPDGSDVYEVNPYRGYFHLKIESGKLIRLEKNFRAWEQTRMVIKEDGKSKLADVEGKRLGEDTGSWIDATPAPDYFLLRKFRMGTQVSGLIDATGKEVEPASWVEDIPLDTLQIDSPESLPEGEIIAAFRGSSDTATPDAIFVNTTNGLVKVPWKAPEIQEAPGTVTVKPDHKDGKWGYIKLTQAAK